MTVDSSDITVLLSSVNRGEAGAEDRLFGIVYAELRQLARAYMRKERAQHTLQPTALVNEVFIRLTKNKASDYASRVQFFGYAARLMRQILVDHARADHAQKRGSGHETVSMELAIVGIEYDQTTVLDLDQALHELEKIDSRQAKVVELRSFAGLRSPEVADALGVSEKTVKRDWAMARAWLHARLKGTLHDESALEQG
ncbi:MAG: ECF-type sigma factor [Bryobacteraceae bacterium]